MDDTAVGGHLRQNRTANPTTPRSDEQARDHGLATYGFKVAVFPKLLQFGLPGIGCISAVSGIISQIIWKTVAEYGPCVDNEVNMFVALWDGESCIAGQAKRADMLAVCIGLVFYTLCFMLTQASISPNLVNASSSKKTGFIVGLGAMGGSIGRVLGPTAAGIRAACGGRPRHGPGLCC